jgi:hypothetical protein
MLNYNDYFTALATQNKAIAHTPQLPKVARIDFEEEIVSIRKILNTNTPCLLYGFPEQKIVDTKADNPHLHTTIMLIVVKNVPNPNDFAAIDQTIQICQDISYQLIAKLYKDRTNTNSQHKPIIEGFDRNSVSFKQIQRYPGPNDYGIAAEFTLHQSIAKELHYQPEFWN